MGKITCTSFQTSHFQRYALQDAPHPPLRISLHIVLKLVKPRAFMRERACDSFPEPKWKSLFNCCKEQSVQENSDATPGFCPIPIPAAFSWLNGYADEIGSRGWSKQPNTGGAGETEKNPQNMPSQDNNTLSSSSYIFYYCPCAPITGSRQRAGRLLAKKG